jgi:pimeloyl-ACP methyl ester carboxylesterase
VSPLAFDRPGARAPGTTRGVQEPLVLLHPLGGDRRVWRPVLALLAPHRDVIAVDLPGFGASPALAGEDTSPTALAAALSAFLREHGLDGGRAHLAGNSLGGWVALETALRGDAASVTAIAPAGLWPRALPPKPEIARTLARAARPALEGLVRSAAGRRFALLGSVAHPERVPAEDAAALVEAYADAPGFSDVNRAMRAQTFTRLAAVDVPVTLVWPDRDRLVARPRDLPPSVREITLRDAGHIPMWDQPQAVADALLAGSAPDADDERLSA